MAPMIILTLGIIAVTVISIVALNEKERELQRYKDFIEEVLYRRSNDRA